MIDTEVTKPLLFKNSDVGILLKITLVVLVVYTLVCVLLYFFQEKFIFFPEKLNSDYQFNFPQKFEEVNLKTRDQLLLNALLFINDRSKGVVFYLHGNSGSLASWGEMAKTYTELGYDVFMMDYRGFGKSEGSISRQDQLYQDVQIAYDWVRSKYAESKIVVAGYSIGTGPAVKIASDNNPGLLILQAPFYSMKDMMKHLYPVIPTFILKYPFETNDYIRNCLMPIVIFHGNRDEVIPYHSSVRLKAIIKKTDTLIILDEQSHNGMAENPEYRAAIKRILL